MQFKAQDAPVKVKAPERPPRKPAVPRRRRKADLSKSAAAHTYDSGYKKWDKFDADKCSNTAEEKKAEVRAHPAVEESAEEDIDAELSRKLSQATPEVRAKLQGLGLL